MKKKKIKLLWYKKILKMAYLTLESILRHFLYEIKNCVKALKIIILNINSTFLIPLDSDTNDIKIAKKVVKNVILESVWGIFLTKNIVEVNEVMQ